MSHQAVNWAIEQRAGGPAPKATLWSIANYANDQWCAWPSQRTICAESEQSPDAVQRWVKALDEARLIRRIPLRYAGRRSIDFFILAPSPHFQRSLSEIEPLLPRGYSFFVAKPASGGSQSAPENAAAINGSVCDAAADVAANAAALERQQESLDSVDDSNDSARAKSGYSPEAAQIAAEIAEIAGVDSAKHAQWFIAGPALIVQQWLDAGYQAWHLIEGTRQVMAGRSSPPDDIRYFRKRWTQVRGDAEKPVPLPDHGDANGTAQNGSTGGFASRSGRSRRSFKEERWNDAFNNVERVLGVARSDADRGSQQVGEALPRRLPEPRGT